MRSTWALAITLGAMSIGCSPRLEGTTWKGSYDKDSVTIEFLSGNNAKMTWAKGFRDKPTTNSSDTTYSIDGKMVYFKNARDKVTAKAQLEGDELVGRPVDFGFEDLDSTARVSVKRQK
jgi:hypothetical protein